ncbi:hypothetical protein Pcinc_031215 [Petrolisthes cinctipes]|uniref:Trafficking protein particle complex subunit 13 n=1 Tax=Petrolisthes cinctipes TaxID=88211 RepID=A0AAE1K561_PETCI|nr:hypothetical protein Pcinc_039479 [Petrolisthes cinctipes]KAK3862960.1 hypothetical protein Pcinc_031215 [Petrolisthes cinctipes]
MDSKDKDHILSLKVMRLTRPSLFTGLSVGCDARDLPGDHLNAETRADIAVPPGLHNTGVGHLLLLPQSFGNIYLGETFSCCLCVHNDSNEIIRDVAIKAVLQMSNQRAVLQMSNQRVPLLGDDEDEPLHQLQPSDTINEVIQHEVKDIGTHILVCAVSYQASSGEQQNFRKFFKFQVMKPLDVKTKFYNAECDEVYLEAGVQNITSGPLCLEKVELEPSPYFTVVSMNKISTDSNSLVFGGINTINTHDTRQYLYCLKPRPEARASPATLRHATAIGKLDIVWRTNMGDRGRLQTSQLQRMAPQYGDVRVTVERIPSVVQLERQFEVLLTITNICERSLDLHLAFLGGGGGSEWSGVSSQTVPTLSPGQYTSLTLSLLPLHTGLQTIAGVRLTDTFLKRTYDYENLAQVFITRDKVREKGEV